MKKSMVILFGVLLVFGVASAAYSLPQYSITNLTNNSNDDNEPQMNDNGEVVWHGDYEYGANKREIWLYDGSVVNRITDNGTNDSQCQINKNGFVVWQGRESDYHDLQLYIYYGTNTTPIQNSFDGSFPQIGDNGYVTWKTSLDDIYLYDGSNTTNLTNDIYRDNEPQMSDNGNFIAWQSYRGTDNTEIFLYDGSTTTRITDNSYYDYAPAVNNNGDVVWSGGKKIWLYDGSATTQIGEGVSPKINNNGDVVWQRDDENYRSEIFLYDGIDVHQITNNSYDDGRASINDNGDIAWLGRVGSDSYDIFLYDGYDTTKITSSSFAHGYGDWSPKINLSGQIVWETGGEIYLASPSNPVPEPATMFLFGSGLIGLVGLKRKFKKS